MKLVRETGKNSFDLKNLTLGKLEVIERALKRLAKTDELGSAGEDVLIFLKNQGLRKMQPFA